jgi:hypothetical protein
VVLCACARECVHSVCAFACVVRASCPRARGALAADTPPPYPKSPARKHTTNSISIKAGNERRLDAKKKDAKKKGDRRRKDWD